MTYCKTLGIAAMLAFGLASVVHADDAGAAPDELFKKLDANADGTLEPGEIGKDQAPFFERLVRVGDADKDGKLSSSEFRDALKHNEAPVAGADQLNDRGPRRGNFDPKRIFGFLDTNKDGKLTREEATDHPPILGALDRLGKEEFSEGEFLEMAAKLRPPRDGEGRPGRAGRPEGAGPEGPEGRKGRGPGEGGPGPDGPRGPLFMKVIDVNKDGKLSRDELAKAAEKFNELDADGDGQIDPRELMGPPPDERGPEMAGEAGPGPRGPFGRRPGGPEGLRGRRPGREGRPEDGPRPPEGGPPRRPHGPEGPEGLERPEGPERPEGLGRPEGPGGPGGPPGLRGPAGGPGREMIGRLFEQLDANDDGKITQEEAPEKMKQRFSRLDANGDGAIDPSELQRVVGLLGRRGEGGPPRGPEGNRPPKKRPDAEPSEKENP